LPRGLEGPIRATAPRPAWIDPIGHFASAISSARITLSFWQYNDREYPGHNLAIGRPGAARSGNQSGPLGTGKIVFQRPSLTLSEHWINQFQILIGPRARGACTVSTAIAPRSLYRARSPAGGRTGRHSAHREPLSGGTTSPASLPASTFWKSEVNIPDWSPPRCETSSTNFGGTFFLLQPGGPMRRASLTRTRSNRANGPCRLRSKRARRFCAG